MNETGALNIPEQIGEINALYTAKTRKEADALGIRNAYRQLLARLSEEDGGTQLSLVEKTGMKAPTVSITLRKMEKEGLVRRVVDEDDLRKTHVFLSETGRELYKTLEERINAINASLLSGLTDAEKFVFEKSIKTIKSKLTV